MRKKIKIYFTDFYEGFSPADNFIVDLLCKSYEIEITPENPDYLLYSCYGFDFLSYQCVRIFYTAENLRPDFNLCDYAIGIDNLHFAERYIYFPTYGFDLNLKNLIRPVKNVGIEAETKKRFCNFIYSNPECDVIRNNFYDLLSNYKPIDSPGKFRNNTTWKTSKHQSWQESKISFQKNYKFSIAFENSSSTGYTSEKIIHAFMAGTIPIYWGNPEIGKEFNTRSFINCHDCNSLEEVVERVIEIDNNDQLYHKMLSSPCFLNNEIPTTILRQKLLTFFENIFNQDLNEARRRPSYGRTPVYEKIVFKMALLFKAYLRVTAIPRFVRKLLKS